MNLKEKLLLEFKEDLKTHPNYDDELYAIKTPCFCVINFNEIWLESIISADLIYTNLPDEHWQRILLKLLYHNKDFEWTGFNSNINGDYVKLHSKIYNESLALYLPNR